MAWLSNYGMFVYGDVFCLKWSHQVEKHLQQSMISTRSEIINALVNELILILIINIRKKDLFLFLFFIFKDPFHG